MLAVELADLVSAELDLQLDAVTYYSDSKVVLGYINNETRHFYVYVSNRVLRIRRSSHPDQWLCANRPEPCGSCNTFCCCRLGHQLAQWAQISVRIGAKYL